MAQDFGKDVKPIWEMTPAEIQRYVNEVLDYRYKNKLLFTTWIEKVLSIVLGVLVVIVTVLGAMTVYEIGLTSTNHAHISVLFRVTCDLATRQGVHDKACR